MPRNAARTTRSCKACDCCPKGLPDFLCVCAAEESKSAVAAEVDLDDMECKSGSDGAPRYYHPCRCGAVYEVAESELLAGVDTFNCTGCSLNIRVLFEEA